MARLRTAAGVLVVCWLVVGGSWAAGQSDGFRIEPFDEVVAVGGQFGVSGAGCGPTSESATVVLVLTPPSGSPGLGTAVIDGRAVFVLPAVSVAGQVVAEAAAAADGTFSATFAVPADAPLGPGYTVVGGCASLLEVAEDGESVTAESLEAAVASTGTLTVEPAIIVDECFAGPPCPGKELPGPPTLRATPSFTG